jgi:HAD superfamily hydrolase (TIGR01509 family)
VETANREDEDVVFGVVFDLDGVLLDSEPVWEEVRRGVVAEAGGTWTPDAQRRLLGMNTREWAEFLSRELGTGLDPDATAAVVIDRMRSKYRAELPLLPDASETVQQIGARWPLALASSSPRELIDAVLDVSGLARYFPAVVSADEVARGKPEPDVYLHACESLGIEPRDCVAIEDSTNGLRAAAAAGLRVIAIPQPSNPPDEDVLARVDRVLQDLSELTVALIEQLG